MTTMTTKKCQFKEEQQLKKEDKAFVLRSGTDVGLQLGTNSAHIIGFR